MKLRSCHPHLACVLTGGNHTSAYLTCGMEKSVMVRMRPRIGGGHKLWGDEIPSARSFCSLYQEEHNSTLKLFSRSVFVVRCQASYQRVSSVGVRTP